MTDSPKIPPRPTAMDMADAAPLSGFNVVPLWHAIFHTKDGRAFRGNCICGSHEVAHDLAEQAVKQGTYWAALVTTTTATTRDGTFNWADFSHVEIRSTLENAG
jgi:hypothetical protein